MTGFEGFDPVEIVRVKPRRRFKGNVPRYYHVTVVRSEAAVDQVRSGVEWGKSVVCPVCRTARDLRRWQRVILEADTWTGENIFEARGLPATYIASERFKKLCETYGIANAVLIPAEEYGCGFH